MADKRRAKSVKSMKVALTVNSKSIKDAGFYFASTADVHITYNRLLFSKYSEVQLSHIQMADNLKLKVLSKGTVSLKVIIDGKALQVNFPNVFYSHDLEYNLLSVKIEKMMVFDNENNIALVGTQIRTGYSVDVPCDKTYQALSSYSQPQNQASWTE